MDNLQQLESISTQLISTIKTDYRTGQDDSKILELNIRFIHQVNQCKNQFAMFKTYPLVRSYFATSWVIGTIGSFLQSPKAESLIFHVQNAYTLRISKQISTNTDLRYLRGESPVEEKNKLKRIQEMRAKFNPIGLSSSRLTSWT
jgi:hypothetical protein